jgi:hypothetical protein
LPYVIARGLEFAATRTSEPGSSRGIQNSARVSRRSSQLHMENYKHRAVATTSNQMDEKALGPEKKRQMEPSESSRRGKHIDCDDKWQG